MSNLSLSTRLPRLAFSDFFEPWSEWFQNGNAGTLLTMPKVNVSESKNNYCLEVAAPGLHKKDFKIEVNGNILTISGQKEHDKEEKEDDFTRREYNYSSFSRSFTLPEGVQQDKIEASYDGGILKLDLPKTEKAVKSNFKEIAVK